MIDPAISATSRLVRAWNKGHIDQPPLPIDSLPRRRREARDWLMATDNLTRRFAVACGMLGQYVRSAAAHVVPAPGAAREGGAQQLTIFYGGRVVVLDGCPPERAAELIRLAAAAQGAPEPALVDMPIARKASLRRFLAKRKDRATSAAGAPHGRKDDEPEPPAKKGKADGGPDGPSTWLALSSMHAR